MTPWEFTCLMKFRAIVRPSNKQKHSQIIRINRPVFISSGTTSISLEEFFKVICDA